MTTKATTATCGAWLPIVGRRRWHQSPETGRGEREVHRCSRGRHKGQPHGCATCGASWYDGDPALAVRQYRVGAQALAGGTRRDVVTH